MTTRAAATGSWIDGVLGDASVWAAMSENASFASAAAWFDTTIVLESGDRAMFLKVYRGRIIDTGRGHGFKGYAFALTGTDETWSAILDRGSRALHRALTAGQIRVRGDLIEFNRAIKLVSLVVDQLADSRREAT